MSALEIAPVDREHLVESWPGVWSVLEPVFRAGDTYAFDRDITEDAARAAWFAPGAEVFVGGLEGRAAATAYLKSNGGGGSAHVANAGFAVAPWARGRGAARGLAEHVLDAARARGFAAMQFNAVVSTNAVAVALWERLGFAIVGRVPSAFSHPEQGLVDVLVMHRFL